MSGRRGVGFRWSSAISSSDGSITPTGLPDRDRPLYVACEHEGGVKRPGRRARDGGRGWTITAARTRAGFGFGHTGRPTTPPRPTRSPGGARRSLADPSRPEPAPSPPCAPRVVPGRRRRGVGCADQPDHDCVRTRRPHQRGPGGGGLLHNLGGGCAEIRPRSSPRFAVDGAAHRVGLRRHQRVDHAGQQRAQQVRTRLGQVFVQEVGRVDTRVRGHRGSPRS